MCLPITDRRHLLPPTVWVGVVRVLGRVRPVRRIAQRGVLAGAGAVVGRGRWWRRGVQGFARWRRCKEGGASRQVRGGGVTVMAAILIGLPSAMVRSSTYACTYTFTYACV